jgi:ribosomal protein L40E
MAVARIVCGACGADIPPGMAACPKCGAVVELPAVASRENNQVCSLCGYRNPATATFCESCGAKLTGSAAPPDTSRVGGAVKRGKPAPARAKANAARREGGAGVKVWQVISGVAVLSLIGVLIYLLIPRDQGTAPPRVVTSPPQATASMAEIQSLQQTVTANPSDAAARLRLANLLHDSGMLLRAIDNYNEYLKLDPRDPNARVDLGICYDQLALQDSANAPRYFAMALKEMQTAADNVPTHQPAAFNLGIVNLHMGNLEESNKWFRRAVELGKDSELGMRAQKILQQHTFSQ